jgi:hypothetical protein
MRGRASLVARPGRQDGKSARSGRRLRGQEKARTAGRWVKVEKKAHRPGVVAAIRQPVWYRSRRARSLEPDHGLTKRHLPDSPRWTRGSSTGGGSVAFSARPALPPRVRYHPRNDVAYTRIEGVS